jgi:hypothetical protein
LSFVYKVLITFILLSIMKCLKILLLITILFHANGLDDKLPLHPDALPYYNCVFFRDEYVVIDFIKETTLTFPFYSFGHSCLNFNNDQIISCAFGYEKEIDLKNLRRELHQNEVKDRMINNSFKHLGQCKYESELYRIHLEKKKREEEKALQQVENGRQVSENVELIIPPDNAPQISGQQHYLKQIPNIITSHHEYMQKESNAHRT